MEELLLFLESIKPMSEGLKDYLRMTLQMREIKKKEFVLRKNRVSDHIFFIQKGLLRCYYEEHDKEICSWFMGKRNVIVSVESFFKRTPSYESIQALEDTSLYGISYDELQYCYEEYPEFNRHGRILTQDYYILAEQRVRLLRSFRANERYEHLKKEQPEIIARVHQKDIASYLGITEEHYSRIKAS